MEKGPNSHDAQTTKTNRKAKISNLDETSDKQKISILSQPHNTDFTPTALHTSSF